MLPSGEQLQQIVQGMPDHLTKARDHLRAALNADRTEPDDPGGKAKLDYWTELLDITERLEDLMGTHRGE